MGDLRDDFLCVCGPVKEVCAERDSLRRWEVGGGGRGDDRGP